MTKEEIFEKLQTEVKIRGLSPRTYKTYMRAIDLFLNLEDKPYEELEEADFRNYLLYLIDRGDLDMDCDSSAVSDIMSTYSYQNIMSSSAPQQAVKEAILLYSLPVGTGEYRVYPAVPMGTADKNARKVRTKNAPGNKKCLQLS